MPVPILMPALSPTMTEGNIAKWLKKEGEKIVPGDIIAEVETDKATMEVEAIDEGVLSRILFNDGTENVEVNKLIGVIIQEDEKEKDVDNFIKKYDENNKKISSHEQNDSEAKEKTIKEEESIKKEEIETKHLSDNKTSFNNKETYNNSNTTILIEKEELSNDKTDNKNDRILISPLARRIAKIENINLESVKGSGPHGRIIKKDLDDFILKDNRITNVNKIDNFSSEVNSFEKVKLTNIRKTIGKRLQTSKQTIPHYYLKTSINIEKLELERKEINDYFFRNNQAIKKISLNDLLIKALALSLERVPQMNATWNEDSIIYYKNVDISVAVATDDGLYTPIIRSACKKRVSEISNEMKTLIDKARNNKLLPEEYNGGCFSISNLGMYGVDEFSAIINPPQAGILAVGGIKEELRKNNNDIISEKILNLTLSVDHRIADGAVAAKLLQNLKFYLCNALGMVV